MFTKAAPQQARLKVSMYGPPGSGKTFTALMFAEGLARLRARRIAFVDTERGTDFYAQAAPRSVHPEPFDFDALYTRSLADVTRAVESIDPSVHGVIVIDSISHLWDAAMEAYSGKRTSKDGIPLQAWGAIKRPYKALIARLLAMPVDVFILGRQKNLFEDDGESLKKIGVAMRAEGETAYEPHICLRMSAANGVVTANVEKDRTGVLQGKLLVNPSFADVEPLIPLLGEVQAPSEDEDERVAKDGELIAADDAKATAKAEKSRTLMADFTARLYAAKTAEDLGLISADYVKQKRYIQDEHRGAIETIGKQRREDIVRAFATEVK